MKKQSMISLILNIVSGNMTKEEKNSAEEFIENNLGNDYGEYLDKPQEYKDGVIKHMYRKTKYADETPERLREILHQQVTGNKRAVH